jgi:hypothetical protein
MKRVTSTLFGFEDRVEIGSHFGAGPILRADDFAIEAALSVDDVGFGVHRGAVIHRDFFGGIAIVGKAKLIGLQKILIGILIFVEADSEDCAAEWSDPALQRVQRRRFVDARGTPCGPEIQDDDIAFEIGEARRFAVKRKREVFFGLTAKAGLALTVVGAREHVEKACDEDENDAGFEIAFQMSVQAPIIPCRESFANGVLVGFCNVSRLGTALSAAPVIAR